eukprot:scaffold4678_cov242-Pinguiococcus_pyrenoidosus.AAC.12
MVRGENRQLQSPPLRLLHERLLGRHGLRPDDIHGQRTKARRGRIWRAHKAAIQAQLEPAEQHAVPLRVVGVAGILWAQLPPSICPAAGEADLSIIPLVPVHVAHKQSGAATGPGHFVQRLQRHAHLVLARVGEPIGRWVRRLQMRSAHHRLLAAKQQLAHHQTAAHRAAGKVQVVLLLHGNARRQRAEVRRPVVGRRLHMHVLQPNLGQWLAQQLQQLRRELLKRQDIRTCLADLGYQGSHARGRRHLQVEPDIVGQKANRLTLRLTTSAKNHPCARRDAGKRRVRRNSAHGCAQRGATDAPPHQRPQPCAFSAT